MLNFIHILFTFQDKNIIKNNIFRVDIRIKKMGVASDHGQFVYTGGVASSEASEQVIEIHIL